MRECRLGDVAVSTQVHDHRDRCQRHQEDDAECADVGQPGEQAQHGILAEDREDPDQHHGDRGLRERTGHRGAPGVHRGQRRGQHPLPAEGEEIPGNRVVEGQQRREQAGHKQHGGNVGEPFADVLLGVYEQQSRGEFLGPADDLALPHRHHGRPGREGVEDADDDDRGVGGAGNGPLRVLTFLAIDRCRLEADERRGDEAERGSQRTAAERSR